MHQLYQSYKQKPSIENHYDAICIGSGLGSITTANLLAKSGKKVLVCEKHYTPGGFTHIFTRNDYEWDVGLHYIGEMHKDSTILAMVFNYISNNNLKWEDMGEVYDRIIIGENEYDFVKGVENFKKKLKHYFPTEVDAIAIDKYFKLLFDVSNAGRNFFMEKAMPDFVNFLASNFLRKEYLNYANKTTKQVLDELSKNDELKAVLAAQFGDYGLPPAKSSFVIHAAVAKHYLNGGFYPIGGSQEIFNTIAPTILKNGGNVLVNAGVQEIVFDGNKAIGVKMQDGKTITANYIISGTGIEITYNHLIPQNLVNNSKVHKKVNELQPSYGHLCLYIGLKYATKELNLNKANYWIYSNNNFDESMEKYEQNPIENDFPVVYISFPSAKDPKWEERYPNKSTVEIISAIPYNLFKQWETTKWKKRGEEYDALKEKFAQRLLQKLYEVEPQLKGKIDYYELSTPLSTQKFANYSNGEIYGLDHTPERFNQKFLKPKTEFKNLFLTGQDIVSVGIGGALMSGVLTASAILNKNMLNEIIKDYKNKK